MKNNSISYKSITGQQIKDWIIPLAELRIQIFKDWPYLYLGSLDYERNYLSRYAQAEKSFINMAFDGEKLIGATSCIWLPHESDTQIKKAFTDRNFDSNKIVYFGESIVFSEYRGLGIGSQFMQVRENFAKNICKADYTAFCSVVRPKDHPLKPSDYLTLDHFWSKRGFKKQDGMFCKMIWPDINDSGESEKTLQFWMKKI
jgi:GNAT superfamily N-acetyltransferase